jgi:hypothetical protein
MRIADVLKNKGAGVLTVAPDTTVSDLLSGLVTRNSTNTARPHSDAPSRTS